MQAGMKYRNADKIAQIPVKNIPLTPAVRLKKPDWMKIKLPSDTEQIQAVKAIMRRNNLHSVCEEAACPNLSECFHQGTATFMILGDICTRRCPFCDVAHGKPLAPDSHEPAQLAQTIAEMQLNYVVITSVDRDDLSDSGAQHFVDCVREIRARNPKIKIETLVPDFRRSMARSIEILQQQPPDVFNHNLETVPRLYSIARPGASYLASLKLLHAFQQRQPEVPTKSGLMMGLGETKAEIIAVLEDLRAHQVSMLTIGQYLAPSPHHLPVARYVPPQEFAELKAIALSLGFTHAACGPLVRSSYHADLQAQGIEVK